jgi:hypothetical protein
MRTLGLALALGISAIACGGSNATPDASSGSCPASVTTGTACSAVADCLTLDRADCAETISCHCDGAHYTCSGTVSAGSSCAAFAGAATCEVEGTGTCDTPPGGGTCNCGSDGTWACVDACPDGCPETEPTAGSACTPDGLVCPYGESSRTCCTCGSGGTYACGGCDQG